MSIQSFPFNVLVIFGVWCPSYWSIAAKIAYKFYSLSVVAALFSVIACQLANLLLRSHDFKSFNDTLFIMLSLTLAYFKAICFLARRERVVELLEMFQENCCLAGDDDFEASVRRKHDRFCRRAGTIFLFVVQCAVACFLLIPLFSEFRKLPFEVLLPYDVANRAFYFLTYAHHAFAAIYSSGISILSDIVVTGFMLHLCGQHQILEHRLRQLPRKVVEADVLETAAVEKRLLKESVEHHVHIYNIAEMIAGTFSAITVGQFCVSALEICLSVYQLTTRTRSVVEGATYLIYISCILGQLFFICYFSNEVALQSKRLSSVLFGIDWTLLSVDFRKNLTIMILRTSKPIRVATGAFVRLSLESFVKVLKASYSGFNVLNSST